MAQAPVDIAQCDIAALGTIAGISNAFEVVRIAQIERRDGDELAICEAPAARRFIKDYDRIEGNAPADWAGQFDLSRWGLFTAAVAGRLVGSVLIAFDTRGVELLAKRSDLAAIWDIRVDPDFRGQGIGAGLMGTAAEWARAQGCRELIVETQDINLGACRFYAKSGFRLREAHAAAYPEFPEETQLIWTRDLTEAAA